MKALTIDLRKLPESGSQLEGELSCEVFDLGPEENARTESPLRYSLIIRRSGDFLDIEGGIEAVFSMECGRCLERYKLAIKKPEFRAEIPLENLNIIDLTDSLREDILLDLPGYPRCEDGNVDVRECPAQGEFDVRQSSESDSTGEADDRNVWGALDDIDIKP